MRNFLVATSALIFGSAAVLLAQNAPAQNDQVMGRGRGGAPFAWNDKDKDGICDLTGRPLGQGPGFGAGRGAWGRGAAAGWGRGAGWRAGAGRGRGMGRGFRAQALQQQPQQQQTAPAPRKQ